MVKTVFFTISLILCATVKVNSLQCYVCYDCPEIKDEYLTSCDSIAPETNTTTSSTTSTSTTSTSTTSSSTTSTSTTTTTTTTVPPPTNTTNNTDTANFLIIVEEPLGIAERANITYECFQGKIHVNNSDVIIRGCAAGRTNETCEQFGVSSCSFCTTDKCNGAWSMQSSSIGLLAAFFLTLLIKE